MRMYEYLNYLETAYNKYRVVLLNEKMTVLQAEVKEYTRWL